MYYVHKRPEKKQFKLPKTDIIEYLSEMNDTTTRVTGAGVPSEIAIIPL